VGGWDAEYCCSIVPLTDVHLARGRGPQRSLSHNYFPQSASHTFYYLGLLNHLQSNVRRIRKNIRSWWSLCSKLHSLLGDTLNPLGLCFLRSITNFLLTLTTSGTSLSDLIRDSGSIRIIKDQLWSCYLQLLNASQVKIFSLTVSLSEIVVSVLVYRYCLS